MNTNSRNKTIIVAHRGASHSAPENTIPSFELAFKENADFIEGDFWLTRDNEIVCIHDPDTKRVSKEKINLQIRTSILAELKKVDIGSWRGSKYTGTTIPTLQGVLQIIPPDKGIYIEIKDDREIFMKKLSEILKPFLIENESSNSNREVRLITFNPKTVLSAKEYFPKIKIYWLFGWYFSKIKLINMIAHKRIMRTLRKYNCDGIDLNAAPYIDAVLVKFFREKNLDFCAYDVDKLEDAIKLINLGVDSITTNSPLEMREKIEKYLKYD